MLFWDEDDRLNLVAGDGYLSYYTYGYDGNRAIKMTGNAAIDQSGTLLNSTNLENITLYPNEYLAVTQAEYTKYYYAGGNRIASKIGTGGFEKMQRLCTYDANITYNANTLLNYVLYHITNPTNQAQDAVPVETCNGYNFNTQLLAEPLPTLYITQTNLNFSQNNLLQQFRQNLAGGTEAVYYFHSDHLGSASWITSGTGGAVQHLQYLPFGEHFVNEQSTGYNERFTFTGKERDAETGYYYHGARFNSSDIGWLSVDPMSDKYPSLTPYNYCAWNPIKLVDKDGEDWILSTGNKVYWYAGNYGDKSDLLHTFNASSGNRNATVINTRTGEKSKMNLQKSKYQYVKNGGPTVEGKYRINLLPDPSRVAKESQGILERNKEGGIEQIPEGYTQAWGNERVRLQPLSVKQPVDENGVNRNRDINSFYFHDSKKGGTSGCTEVESDFFTVLKEYRDAGNKYIDVKVEYPNGEHSTTSYE